MAVYYASNPLQQCIVCGRQFIRHRDKVCEVDCAERGGQGICAAIRRADPGGGVAKTGPICLDHRRFLYGRKNL